MKKGILSAPVTVVLTVLLFFSCRPTSDQAAVTATAQPAYGGKLVVGIPRDIDTFNPLFSESVFAQEINHLMLLGLADLNEKSEFVPELAESWESGDERRSLIYHLRRGARWSDGQPVSAYDVKFSYDLLMDTLVASPHRDVAEYVRQVVVVDSYTVRFEFTQPYPYEVFDTAGEILPRHILENADRKSLRSHPFGRMPLASGPFMLKKWDNQQYVELVPNPNYFGGRPFLDRVIFKIIPNQANLLTQLRTGEIDMVIGVSPEDVQPLREANPNVRIHPVSGRVYYYTSYNQANPMFSEVKVRQALTMAVDRQRIIDALLFGYGRPCVGCIPPMLDWAYNDQIQPFPYDPVSARQLLAECGWTDHDGDGWLDKDGRKFDFVLKTDAANQLKSDVAIIIQEQLRKIGISVQIQPVEWTTLLEELRARNFDAYIGGWSASLYVDPTPIFHSSATDIFNYNHYSNPEVDRLIEQGREEIDPQKAAPIWKEMQELVYRDQPYTFLFWIDRIVAINDRFENVTPVPLSSLYGLENWYDRTVSNLAASEGQ